MGVVETQVFSPSSDSGLRSLAAELRRIAAVAVFPPLILLDLGDLQG